MSNWQRDWRWVCNKDGYLSDISVLYSGSMHSKILYMIETYILHYSFKVFIRSKTWLIMIVGVVIDQNVGKIEACNSCNVTHLE